MDKPTEGPLALMLEWATIRAERRAIPTAASIPPCEQEDHEYHTEGPCYGRGRLYHHPACDPCQKRLARFTQIKYVAARLRGVEARMVRAAQKAREEGKK